MRLGQLNHDDWFGNKGMEKKMENTIMGLEFRTLGFRVWGFEGLGV